MVRREDPVPQRAGASSRTDFVLKKEEIIVEVKKTHIQCVMRLLISASGGSSLAIDHCSPVENVACFVNGFLVHVVVSHRHLHVTVAHQISKRW
jgi:hypothetical protein